MREQGGVDGRKTDEAARGSASPGHRHATMRAIVQTGYGTEEVLQLAEVPVPAIAPDEVLVRVAAAGLDRGTWHVMTGTPLLVRPAFGLRRPRQPVPGLDLAGSIVAVGAAVTRFRVGDAVHGIGRGSFAEHAAALERKLAPLPPNLTPAEAAVVPVSGLTALQAVRDAGRVTAGQRVLVLGASGGVGTFAVQVTRALGAEVTAVCSAAEAELVRSLGAGRVLDHARDDLADLPPHDVIVDIGGRNRVAVLRRLLTPRGTLVLVGGEGGGRVTGGMGRGVRAAARSPLLRQRLVMLVSRERAEDLEALDALIVAGTVTPVLDRTFPLAEAAAAMRHLTSGRVTGKVALTV